MTLHKKVKIVFLICFFLPLLLPVSSHAKIVKSCIPWNPCGCGEVQVGGKCTKTGGPEVNTNLCPVGTCTDITNGLTSYGRCFGPGDGGCKGLKYDAGAGNEGGATDAGLKALQGLLDQVMKALMGGMGGGMMPMGGGAPPPSGGTQPMPQEPNVLDQIRPSTSDALRDALSGESEGEGNGILDSVFGIFKSDDKKETSTTVTATGTVSSVAGEGSTSDDAVGAGVSGGQGTSAGNAGVQVSGDDAATLSGERNQIRSSDNEATLEAGVRDDEGNSEVAGFYGFTTRAIGQISVVERLCTSRPWANSFVSRIIPSSFFDGLCVRRGFDVTVVVNDGGTGGGVQAPANITEVENQVKARIEERVKPNVQAGEAGMLCEPESARPGADVALSFSCGAAELTGTSGFTVADVSATSATVNPIDTAQYAIACSDSKTYSCIVQVFDPRVAIWADPEHVSLGTRTTIFWTTEDVDNCVVKGPSFSETGPFGGASTVPINGLSEYTITCIAPDGVEITETTTVDLSI